jgi:hypothetical protein
MKITEVIVDPLHGAVKHKPFRRFLAFLCSEPLYCAHPRVFDYLSKRGGWSGVFAAIEFSRDKASASPVF